IGRVPNPLSARVLQDLQDVRSKALGVKRQEVVSRAGESGHGCVTSDSLMGAMPIVVMDPALEHVGTLRGMVIRDAVGPFTKRRLDEALGLAVGLRPVSTGEAMLKAQRSA